LVVHYNWPLILGIIAISGYSCVAICGGLFIAGAFFANVQTFVRDMFPAVGGIFFFGVIALVSAAGVNVLFLAK
jgi:hypothetical protein